MTGQDTIITMTEDETRTAGALLGSLARPNDVIALSGGLGAGKTSLVQGIAEALGVRGRVSSPTYNLLLVHPGPLTLYHFDLYRLEHAQELEGIDFYETVESGGVSAIEWADRFVNEMPPDRLDVCIEVLDPERRAMHVHGTGERAQILARQWLAGGKPGVRA